MVSLDSNVYNTLFTNAPRLLKTYLGPSQTSMRELFCENS